MTVDALIKTDCFCQVNAADTEASITGVYSGDLLSDIMAHAKKGDILFTVMAHENTLAVASMLALSAVVLTETTDISEKLAATACEHNINLFCTCKSTFDASLLLDGLLKGRECIK